MPAPVRADSALSAQLRRFVAQHQLPGLAAAVVSDTAIIAGVAGVRMLGLEAPVRVDDRFHLGSLAKPMSATLIATLVEEGRLAWTTTPAEVFPELRDAIHPALRDVTLAQLLAHVGGITPLESPSPADSLPPLAGTPMEQRRALAAWLLRRPPVVPVGQRRYSNGGATLAAAMAERAAGAPWEALITTRVFQPLGMRTAGFGWPASARPDEPWGHVTNPELGLLPHPPNGRYRLEHYAYLRPSSDVHTSVVDLARFAQMHLRGLRGQRTVVGPDVVARMHTPLVGTSALGWGRSRGLGVEASTHDGGAGTFYALIAVVPSRNLAVVLVSNCDAEAAVGQAFRSLLASRAARAGG